MGTHQCHVGVDKHKVWFKRKNVGISLGLRKYVEDWTITDWNLLSKSKFIKFATKWNTLFWLAAF